MKNNKKMEDKIQLGAIVWTVETTTRKDIEGQCFPAEHKMIISNQFSQQHQELAFYHELTHAILYTMGNDLFMNEEFVHTFSTFLHQALKNNTQNTQ